MCKKILIDEKAHIEDWMILDNGSLKLLEKTIIECIAQSFSNSFLKYFICKLF